MATDVDPHRVAERLEALRLLYVPENVEEARERLRRERPVLAETVAQRVASNLAELRALYELAGHLARARAPGER